MNKKELGTKIRERRQELGITQEDLAELSETSSKTVREVEKGNANPQLDTLMSILAILGLVFLVATLINQEDE